MPRTKRKRRTCAVCKRKRAGKTSPCQPCKDRASGGTQVYSLSRRRLEQMANDLVKRGLASKLILDNKIRQSPQRDQT